ncbi:hypothetical protein VRRI112168_14865 [Vreelandella rituensis]|uniref:Uncharacterized protein n=1 Tax=Vreelandella rituensis TaxID=2282306 RepID=A0A368UAW4_9GAMM|nr:hypothetical protein [Halomonas rituensis]RCV93796.1 hypothetical protein DU506_01165 [Halomonas rituensis]
MDDILAAFNVEIREIHQTLMQEALALYAERNKQPDTTTRLSRTAMVRLAAPDTDPAMIQIGKSLIGRAGGASGGAARRARMAITLRHIEGLHARRSGMTIEVANYIARSAGEPGLGRPAKKRIETTQPAGPDARVLSSGDVVATIRALCTDLAWFRVYATEIRQASRSQWQRDWKYRSCQMLEALRGQGTKEQNRPEAVA